MRGRNLVAGGIWELKEGRNTTHNLEFTANVQRSIWAKFVSDPGLNYKIPTYLSPQLLLPPLPVPFSPLSFSFSLLYLFYFWMYTMLYSLSLSSPPSVSLSLWEWDSCPTMKLWKYEHPPEGWLSESKVRRGRHTVVSHWIFHLNPWNIHCWGQRTRTTWVHCNNVSLFVQLELLSLALVLIKWGWLGFIRVCVCVTESQLH